MGVPLEDLAEVLQGGAGDQGAGPWALPAALAPLPQPEPLLRDSLPEVGSLTWDAYLLYWSPCSYYRSSLVAWASALSSLPAAVAVPARQLPLAVELQGGAGGQGADP